MKITTLLFPALLLMGAASAYSPPEVPSLSAMGGEYDELNAEYTTAVTAWEEAEDDAGAHPSAAFWPRFAALSTNGNGEAKLWLVSNMRAAKVVKTENRKQELYSLFRDLTSEFNDENWFGGVLTNLAASLRVLGEESTLKFYDVVIAETIEDNNLAGALYFAGYIMKRSETETLHARGEAYLARIEKDLAKTTWIKEVQDLRAWEAVQVGQMAPNFDGKTIDGFEFDLAEYRGQVVLLDFYGFW